MSSFVDLTSESVIEVIGLNISFEAKDLQNLSLVSTNLKSMMENNMLWKKPFLELCQKKYNRSLASIEAACLDLNKESLENIKEVLEDVKFDYRHYYPKLLACKHFGYFIGLHSLDFISDVLPGEITPYVEISYLAIGSLNKLPDTINIGSLVSAYLDFLSDTNSIATKQIENIEKHFYEKYRSNFHKKLSNSDKTSFLLVQRLRNPEIFAILENKIYGWKYFSSINTYTNEEISLYILRRLSLDRILYQMVNAWNENLVKLYIKALPEPNEYIIRKLYNKFHNSKLKVSCMQILLDDERYGKSNPMSFIATKEAKVNAFIFYRNKIKKLDLKFRFKEHDVIRIATNNAEKIKPLFQLDIPKHSNKQIVEIIISLNRYDCIYEFYSLFLNSVLSTLNGKLFLSIHNKVSKDILTILIKKYDNKDCKEIWKVLRYLAKNNYNKSFKMLIKRISIKEHTPGMSGTLEYCYSNNTKLAVVMLGLPSVISNLSPSIHKQYYRMIRPKSEK